MKVLLAPHGTRGDVQPLLALARGLRERGHEPSFLVPDDCVRWIRDSGFPCEPNGIDVAGTFGSRGAAVASGRWPWRQFVDVVVPALFESFGRVDSHVDAIVGSGAQVAAASVAEQWGLTDGNGVFCPCAVPNDASPPPMVKTQALPRFLNRFLWEWGMPLAGLALRRSVNGGRARLGLAPLFNPLSHLTRHATLLAADPDLAPLGDDAPLTVIPTDAWVLDDRQPDLDPRIARFLDLNPAPIYVEFDSMNASRAGELADHVVAAGHAVGRGVLMAGGQASLGQDIVDSEDVLAAGELPHQAVLPRVAAAVHHGGAGTTTAVARAGVPQVVLPHILDQFYWAHRVAELGLGPRALPVSLVTADILAERLHTAIDDPRYAARAAGLAQRIAARNGTADAVADLEQLVAAWPAAMRTP